jgi:hypothetical protein
MIKFLSATFMMIMIGFYSICYSQQWVSTYRGPFRGDAPSINEAHAIALTGENAYVAGFSTDSVCNSAMCIILYDPDGVQLWVENYPDSGSGR